LGIKVKLVVTPLLTVWGMAGLILPPAPVVGVTVKLVAAAFFVNVHVPLVLEGMTLYVPFMLDPVVDPTSTMLLPADIPAIVEKGKYS